MAMKILFVSVVLCFSLVGCTTEQVEKGNSTVQVQARKLTDEEKIDLLRKEADRRGLEWKVFCTRFFEEDPEGFEGVALKRGAPDDDTTDRWMEQAATQADAAYALYISIKGSPTHPARPPEKVKRDHTPYMCPLPELRGN